MAGCGVNETRRNEATAAGTEPVWNPHRLYICRTVLRCVQVRIQDYEGGPVWILG